MKPTQPWHMARMRSYQTSAPKPVGFHGPVGPAHEERQLGCNCKGCCATADRVCTLSTPRHPKGCGYHVCSPSHQLEMYEVLQAERAQAQAERDRAAQAEAERLAASRLSLVGEQIKAEMQHARIDYSELAMGLGVSGNIARHIIDGDIPLNRSTINRLAIFFRTTEELWLRLAEADRSYKAIGAFGRMAQDPASRLAPSVRERVRAASTGNMVTITDGVIRAKAIATREEIEAALGGNIASFAAIGA